MGRALQNDARSGMSRRELIRNAGIAGAAAWTAPIIIDSVASRALATTTSCIPCGASAPGGIPGGGSGGFPSSPTCNIDNPDTSKTWYVYKIPVNGTCGTLGGNVLQGIQDALDDLASHGVAPTDGCPSGSATGSCNTAGCTLHLPSNCNIAISATFGGGLIHAGNDEPCTPKFIPCKSTSTCDVTVPDCSTKNLSFLEMIVCCS